MKVPAGRPAHLQKQTYYLKNIWATKRAVTLLLCALVAFNVVFVPFQVLIFFFFFFFYYPVLSPFTITTASGDPICHIIFGGITTKREKKNRFILVIHETRMLHFHFFFLGFYFAILSFHGSAGPFLFSPFCSYRLTFITASTHALSSTLLQPPLSPFIIIISLLRSHLSSFLFFFDLFSHYAWYYYYTRDMPVLLGFPNTICFKFNPCNLYNVTIKKSDYARQAS